MITTILSDFSFVILFPKNSSYAGKLNNLNFKLTNKHDNYDFFSYFELNQPLLDYYKSLKKDYSINIFTAGTIPNHPSLKKIINPIFDHIFTTKDYNISKTDPSSYKLIAEKLGKKTKEILFIDDQKANLQAASEVGIITIHYKDMSQLNENIKNSSIMPSSFH